MQLVTAGKNINPAVRQDLVLSTSIHTDIHTCTHAKHGPESKRTIPDSDFPKNSQDLRLPHQEEITDFNDSSLLLKSIDIWNNCTRNHKDLGNKWLTPRLPLIARNDQILNTKDSAPGPDSLPYALCKHVPQVTLRVAPLQLLGSDTGQRPNACSSWCLDA